MENNIKESPVKFREDLLYFQHFMLIFVSAPNHFIFTFTLNISNLKIPFTDFKLCINTFLHNQWKMSWNSAVLDILHSIKPSLGEWQPTYRIDRKEEGTFSST